ncbi:MAG: uracil-DNA glycosylase [Chloroflexi bacterium]|nr:uracil-DNA glycosylase [Chloroflexota bacterium]
MSQSRETLEQLNRDIVVCERCPRLVAYRQRIALEKRRAFRDWDYWGKPVPSGGDPEARVLMVGLAPGAHGSNRTGRMFTGDGSGDFLTPALFRADFANQSTSHHSGDGLTLNDLYITAVAHCAPPDNKPTLKEIANCRPYLVQHLRLLSSVQVILALGQIAFAGTLAALREVGHEPPRPRPAFRHAGQYTVGPYMVIASYHPSRQNTQTGRLTEEMFDDIFRQVKRSLSGG